MTEVIGDRLGPTVILIGLGELIAIIVGLLLGAYAGWRRGTTFDRIGNGHQPDPVLDAVLRDRHAADHRLRGGPRLVPDLGHVHAGASYDSALAQVLDFGRHLVLPLTTVSLGLIGAYSILMRSSIIETRAEDYITTARAKGLTDGRILRSHAFPNAMLPDGHDHRDQPRVRGRRARSRPRSCSTGRASGR